MLDSNLRKQFIKLLNKINYGSLKVTLLVRVKMKFIEKLSGANTAMQIFDWRMLANETLKGDVGFVAGYRVQNGKYDYIFSIEMFETVGIRFWPAYFNKFKQLLKPGGKILLQTIVMADDLFKHYTKNADKKTRFYLVMAILSCCK
jgi:2-polyprenyl-3-methyl-5-hydroxy-6-metoxy-1,4-benzoquinol methylase